MELTLYGNKINKLSRTNDLQELISRHVIIADTIQPIPPKARRSSTIKQDVSRGA